MPPIAAYLLKVILCSGILFLYYHLALRNKRFHYYNRFYLLVTLCTSITLPLLHLNWFTIQSTNGRAIELLKVIYVNEGSSVTVNSAAKGMHISAQYLALLIYTAVAAASVLMLAWRMTKIYRLKKRYNVTNMGEFEFINTDLPQAPFSFLRNLFWRSDIDLDDAAGRQILQHELTHIRQKHSWDKIVMQTVLAIFWINPFFWLIKRELFMLHEFIADEKAIENNDGAGFAAMLLTSQYGRSIFSPAQSFSYSPIKRRLNMITNLTKPRYSYARRIMLLPMLAAVAAMLAFNVQAKHKANNPGTLQLSLAPAGFTVIIDAGHGGSDAGATGNNLEEKNIDLAIAQKIAELAPGYNINAVLTRNSDVPVEPAARIKTITANNASAMISIHVDAGNTQPGISAYVSKENLDYTGSKLLGSAILQSVSKNYRASQTLRERQATIHILKYSTVPAVLVECGVIDNPADADLLRNEGKITTIANDILKGIAAYASSKASDMIAENTYQAQLRKRDTTPAITLTSPDKLMLRLSNDSTTNKPLLVVDGEEKPYEVLKQIKPDDIASVEILKDEMAKARYGQKGTNGVIIVSTKSHTKYYEIKGDEHHSGSISINTTDEKLANSFKTLADSAKNIYTTQYSVEAAAHFPGGDKAWADYLVKNLHADIVDKKGGPPGTYTVVVSFSVDEQGNISAVKALNNPGFGTAEEAIRVIKTSPKWVPATINDKPAKMQQKQSISFSVTK